MASSLAPHVDLKTTHLLLELSNTFLQPLCVPGSKGRGGEAKEVKMTKRGGKSER